MKNIHSLLYSSRPFSRESKRDAVKELADHTVPDRDFYLLVIGAVLLAVCGIFLDSIPVLIASMIVAPLAYPILALGLAFVAGDTRLAARAGGMLGVSCVIAIVLSALATVQFGSIRIDPVFISFSSDPWLATAVAVIAGCIAAYGLVRPKVGSAMTGIGIAVSLMPPLVATGMHLAQYGADLYPNAFALFLLNVIGILAGSMAVFAVFGLGRMHRDMNQK